MKLSDQLITRLNNELNIKVPVGTKIKYLNPTINQQAQCDLYRFLDGEM